MRIYKKEIPRQTRLASTYKLLFVSVLIVLAGAFLALSGQIVKRRNDKIPKVYNFISPLSTDSSHQKKNSGNIFGSLLSVFKPSLSRMIEKKLSGVKGTYGVVVKHLQNGEEVFINKDEPFYMASLYKLMVMELFYKSVNEGKLAPNVPIGNSTWGDAVESMITVSDNLAGKSLGDTLGWDKIEAEMKSLGLSQTVLTTDLRATPQDMAILLEKIGRGQAVSQEASRGMISLLLKQRLNSRLPKYLPSEAKVAHKTGELDMNRHDAGIVFLPDGTSYIIVVMSKDSGPDAQSSEEVAQISKLVYEYFSKGR